MRRIRRRTILLAVIVPVLLAWAGYSAYVYFWVFTAEDRRHWGDEGFPSDARKLRAVIEPFPDPESVREKNPDLFASRYFGQQQLANGEWIFGVATDSHEGELAFEIVPRRQGGTIVLKDSRGRISVFYGHVCGSLRFTLDPFREKNLDDFYRKFGKYYTEQFLPP